MTIAIQLDDSAAIRLQMEASALNVSPEKLASDLLGEAIAQLGSKSGWPARNQRRCDLIRQEIHGGGLTAEETAELEGLNAEADRRLAPLDQKRLEWLRDMEERVQKLPAQ
jgi:hypothetical protein